MCDPTRDYITYNEDGTQNKPGERFVHLSRMTGYGGVGLPGSEGYKKQQEINARVFKSVNLENDYGQQVHGRPTFRHQEEESEVGQDEAVGGRPGRHDDNQRKKALEVKKGKKRQKQFTSLGAESIPITPTTGITTP